jgi:hypothetical protein
MNFALLSTGCGILSLMSLFALHFASPEFKPNWRMISEYAFGKNKWLITAFFMLWGTSSILLAVFLWGVVDSKAAQVGVILLLISGIGEWMGGLFDVKHKHHGLAFLLGIPSLPVAALLIGYHIADLAPWNQSATAIILTSHVPWISLVLMAAGMATMFAAFKRAGMPMGPNIPPPDAPPAGAFIWSGYANRLLVICYVGWLVLVSGIYLTNPTA